MAKVLSIEITLSQIKVAEISTKGKTPRILNAFLIPVPQGAIEDGHIRDTAGIAELLKKELAARNIRTKKVSFTMESSRIASREVRIPYVKINRIQSILEANSAEYFPVDISKYVLSYDIIDIENKKEDKDTVKQYHLMVYASPKSISLAYEEVSRSAGLQLVRLDSTGESLYRALKPSCQEGLYMVMKIEEKTTMIEIIRQGELVLQRRLNYGIGNTVETVCMYPVFGRGLDFEEAMDVLRTRKCIRNAIDLPAEEAEPEDTDEFVREARREVTESLRYLVGNITRMMDYYLSRNADADFTALYCCGLGGEIKGLTQLLTTEIGMQVTLLRELNGILVSREEALPMWNFIACAGSVKSPLNLMEAPGKKKKASEDSLRGAVIVFLAGAAGAVLLAAGGIGIRMMHEKDAEYLKKRIDEESSIEEIYQTYNQVKNRYENFQVMYQYTNTPNEGLVNFIEEMEEKMPSALTVETFSSTGTQVSFSARMSGKSEAANTLMQLRTFESLSDVTTTGIDEGEDGSISMSVTCTYAEPALLDGQQ